MLNRLIIHNYAIISELDLSISPGLSIITGETGAGKSILLGALGLALGKRADGRILTDEKTKCIVEAHFTLDDTTLQELFEREGLDFDKEVICRREIAAGGKSRSFVNDTPVSLKILQEITGYLIELHHQHDNLALQSKDYQRQVLDTLSAAGKQHREYSEIYQSLLSFRNELQKLKDFEATSARRKDFLQFQISELESAQLKSGEVATLEEEQNILQHAESIDHALAQLQRVMVDGQYAILTQLTQLKKQVEAVRTVSPPLSAIADRLEALRLEVQDLGMEGSKLEGMAQNNPARLEKVQARLNQLYILIKKYQCSTEDDLVQLKNSFTKELSELASVGDQVQALETKIGSAHTQLQEAGKQLTVKRTAGAKKIIPSMNKLLLELGMPNGKFSIDVVPAQPGPDGMDDIQFLFTANKGMSPQPIQNVASGGELSRLSLAIKSLYAAQAALPTIIFDEIDTGISGEVAWRMGQLIRDLAKGHQILMITHSPQIAAHAAIQYHVSKVQNKGRDESSVQLLTTEKRQVEIAKMLSGDPPSKEALANAKSLMLATSK